MTDDRRARIMAGLDAAGFGLEIGGGYNPIASKDEFRVEHLDHTDREGLIRKYAAQSIDTSRIQEIDYVWSGQRYASLVGGKRYDWIIASHVIEHVPDPIAFLNDCAAILTERGVLSLAVPDKRACFDYYRPTSGLARLIDSFVRGDTRTTAGAAAEHIMYASSVNGAITWDAIPRGTLPEFVHTPEQGRDVYESVVRDRAEHDVHAWAFTPASFRLIAEDVYRLGLITLRERSWQDTDGFEFFIQLSRQGSGPGVERTTLAREALIPEAPAAVSPELTPLAATVDARPEDLVRMADAHPRRQILVRGTSGHPQFFLIRDGRRCAIATPAWISRNDYSGCDVTVVEDEVIMRLAEGDVLGA